MIEEILSLILCLLIIASLTLLQFRKRRKRKLPKRYSCLIVEGEEVDRKYF